MLEHFTRRVLEHFERKDLEEHFGELTRLKQTRSIEAYISEFLMLLVMVSDISESKRVFMFIEGLIKPLKGLVKSNIPTTLQDVVGRAKDLQDALPRVTTPLPPREGFPQRGRDTRAPPSRGN